MSERDPCLGCRHLRTYACPFQRPTCARNAHYGGDRCRRERVPVGPDSVRDDPNRGRRG